MNLTRCKIRACQWAAAAATGLFLFGCAQQPVAINSQEQVSYPAYAASAGIAKQLVAVGSLDGLVVVDLRAQRRNDVLAVQANVANTTMSPRTLYYRFVWLDETGMRTGMDEAWKPLAFLDRQQHLIQGVASTAKAVDFRIELRSDAAGAGR